MANTIKTDSERVSEYKAAVTAATADSATRRAAAMSLGTYRPSARVVASYAKALALRSSLWPVFASLEAVADGGKADLDLASIDAVEASFKY